MNTEENPWTIIDSKEVYESPWILVKKFDVLNPVGKPATYSTVSFKNKAIGVIPLDKHYNTWIVGQYRFPIQEYSWEIPEGGGDPKVSYRESAERELLEETGITAKKYTEIMRMHTSNSASDEEAIVFIAQELSFETASPEETEVLNIRKLPFEELYKMVHQGKVSDAITIAAVYKTKVLIEEGLI
ncbi:MAG: NUDIX hydrolase [Bacteroidia bacterium]|nr:NUDIX hydrolase [Bacteroidia bacterium]